MSATHSVIEPIAWRGDELVLIDQTRLPHVVGHVHCRSAADVAHAIATMVVRGAPAIGIAAAYGAALAARDAYAGDRAQWRAAAAEQFALLRRSRPTAVNLMWAIDTMARAAEQVTGDPWPVLLETARRLHADDLRANRAMGDLGARLIAPGSAVLTHCNAGALATAGYGTALGVVRSAWRDGRLKGVYATETRPWLQGARLTAFELAHDGIDVTLIADSAAAWLMRSGAVQWVVTGADRIAANGDTANKIGTYALATLARAHGLRFMVAAPVSTIDRATASGDDIPIEQRAETELTMLGGQPLAAPGVRASNPVFDVTPAGLIDAIVTERGVVERPDRQAMARLLEG